MAKPIELSNVTKAYLEEYQRILKNDAGYDLCYHYL